MTCCCCCTESPSVDKTAILYTDDDDDIHMVHNSWTDGPFQNRKMYTEPSWQGLPFMDIKFCGRHQDSQMVKQARKLQATLVQNYDSLTYSLTGVKCRATSVAKKTIRVTDLIGTK